MPQLLLCKSCSPLDFTSLWPLSSEWLLHNKTISKRLVWFLPPSFFAAGHYYNRTKIVALSAILWALCTFLFARTTTIYGAMLIWACNGIGLAAMIPNSQALVADYYPAQQRGRAFGMLLAVGSLGSMVGVLFATNMGGYTFFGIEGWRMAFHGVAGFSVLMGVAIWVLAVDPRCAGGGWKPTPMHPPARMPKGGIELHLLRQGIPQGMASACEQGFEEQKPLRSEMVGFSITAAAAVTAAAGGGEGVPGLGEDLGPSLYGGSCHGIRRSSSCRSMSGGGRVAGGRSSVSQLLQDIWVVISTPSFIVIVVQVGGQMGVARSHGDCRERLTFALSASAIVSG